MSKKVLVTTPIYYPNDKLHIGHAYTTSLADAIARFQKLIGNEVYFITGSDEHGQKIEDKAKEMGEDPYTYVSKIVESFKGLWEKLGINNDLFIRTTDKQHEEYVANTFVKFQEMGFIYKGEYEGNYCKSCEEFFTDKQLAEGNTCPNCGKDTQVITEESYFLKISEFSSWIEDKLKTAGILEPQFKADELINNFIKEGLQDLSITRTSFDWGIKVPNDENHVIYVWLDALLNYVTALTYEESPFSIEEIWSEDSDAEIIQLVGKEITRFHAIYWPIMLHMLGLRTPKVYAHGWLLQDGRKMSKSLGNVVDPIKLLDDFGKDAVRWYLASGISFGDDGNISEELVKEMTNGILVNKYSNLVARTLAMLEQKRDLTVPVKNIETDESKKLIKQLDELREKFETQFKEIKLTQATKTIVETLDVINGYIDITEPWKIDGDELDVVLNDLVHSIIKVNIMMSPFLVDSTAKVLKEFIGKETATFADWETNIENKKLNKVENLFMRIK